MDAIRINRYLADAGFGSRRQTEKLISDGRVKLNGKTLLDLGVKVDVESDVVEVDGIVVSQNSKKLPFENHSSSESSSTWLYNKAMGLLCTRDDPMGRPTIWDELPHLPPPFQAIGRLDKDSTGLLLITKDGELAQRLMHPSFEVSKIYEVRARGDWSEQKQAQLLVGVEMLEGGLGKAETLRASHHKYTNVVDLRLLLRHGKKREIRYSLAALDMEVLSLHRVQLCQLKLGEMKKGDSRPLTPAELELLN